MNLLFSGHGRAVSTCLLAAWVLAAGPDAQNLTRIRAGQDVTASVVGMGQASLDVDTCGCPTAFDAPSCIRRTHWTIDNNANVGSLTDPDHEPFEFEIWVWERQTDEIVSGGGTIYLTNSGEQSAVLSSIAVLLEKTAAGGTGNAPGPSGQNWTVLQAAVANESADCAALGVARTCYGDVLASAGNSLVLLDPNSNDIIALEDLLPIPATLDNDGDGLRDEDPALPSDPSLITGGCSIIDNDGDGLYDEDPINGIDDDMDGLVDEDDPDDDGDGLVDEDGACEDAVVINFTYEFDVAGLGLAPGDGVVPSADDLRINLLATFGSAGGRGGSGATCTLDANCNGMIDPDNMLTPLVNESEMDSIRTIQQRLRFDPPACATVCDPVTLTSSGAVTTDPSCVEVTSDSLNEVIYATGIQNMMWKFKIHGEATCKGKMCRTAITATAELNGSGCDDTLVEGSPNGASFAVFCGFSAEALLAPGDFCTQTQAQFGSRRGYNFLKPIWNQIRPAGMMLVGDYDGLDGDSLYAYILTSPESVRNYLPAVGPFGQLTADLSNPLSTSSGTLGGWMAAAELNLALDDAGIRTLGGVPAHPPGTLRQLEYLGCVEVPLIGMTVGEVMDLAHRGIAGEPLPAGITLGYLFQAVGVLNREFQDCDTYRGCLGAPQGLLGRSSGPQLR